MRRIAVAIMGTISGLVLLFSYHTSTSSRMAVSGGTTVAGAGTATPTVPDPAATSGTSTVPSTPSTGTAPPAPSTSSPAAPAAPAGSSGSFTGSSVDTRWGAVQVQITVQDGKITQAQAVKYPHNNGRDQQINAYAVPTLNQEVVTAQSANIDAVSGATVTSDGYLQSLQSAIDQAHL